MARLPHTKRLSKHCQLRQEFELNHYSHKNSDKCYKALPPITLIATNDTEARLWHNVILELLGRSKTIDRFTHPEVYSLLYQLTRGINHSLKQKYER